MEFLIRDTCRKCGGSGRGMTDRAARAAAVQHNEAARRCNNPNYLSAEYFAKCRECGGAGKKESWIDLHDFASMAGISNLIVPKGE